MEIIPLKKRVKFIPTLAGWHYGQWAYLNPESSVEHRISSLKDELHADGIPVTYVAVSKDTLLGSASLVPHDMHTRMDLSPWLASVFVAPEHRNRGVGSALIDHVAKEAGKLGYQTIYLFTPDREAFYKRLGWTFFERTEYRGHPVPIMMLNIA